MRAISRGSLFILIGGIICLVCCLLPLVTICSPSGECQSYNVPALVRGQNSAGGTIDKFTGILLLPFGALAVILVALRFGEPEKQRNPRYITFPIAIAISLVMIAYLGMLGGKPAIGFFGILAGSLAIIAGSILNMRQALGSSRKLSGSTKTPEKKE